VDAAVAALRERGVRDVMLRSGEPLAAVLGAPLGGDIVLVSNRPALRRVEPLAWKLVACRR
jgi:hypothetical protein